MAVDPPISPQHVDAWLAELLGSPSDADAEGLLHVCSSFADAAGALHAIRVGPEAPAGPTDGFLLRAARARADVVVTSGRIVRSEPDLDHELGKGPLGSLLRAYRARVLARSAPPRTLVVSHGADLPAVHPLWSDWTQVTIWTAPSRVAALRAKLPPEVEVVAAVGEGLAPAFDYLAARGDRRIALELGPRAVRELYERGLVRELWSSRFEGTSLPEAARGGAWPFDTELLHAWARGQGACIEEASGRWRFQRCVPAGAMTEGGGAA